MGQLFELLDQPKIEKIAFLINFQDFSLKNCYFLTFLGILANNFGDTGLLIIGNPHESNLSSISKKI